jgi:hypothetical protein
VCPIPCRGEKRKKQKEKNLDPKKKRTKEALEIRKKKII